ncbi:replication endonuclease [bacterium]|nr:replication endonuclease [bacterium]
MYGLSKHDLEFINKKIQYQKDFLLDNSFTTSSGQVKTLLDVSFSANHSERYYAQLTNKINTMTEYSKDFDLSPSFLTMTLDGFYRDLLRGDYTRFDKFSVEKKEEIMKSIPDNDKYGFLRQKILDREKFTINDLYKILSYQFGKFTASYPFIKMRKQGFKFMYIRTVEPHKKDGVPHFHVMLYINKRFFESVREVFNKNFPAPQNEKEGFVTDIYNPAGYILKYITKSFTDVKHGNDLDYIQVWFIKHRIMRCVTSKNTIPQWIYQKCYSLESDWYYLTDFIYNEDKFCEWSYKDDYFHFIDLESSREIHYEQGVISLIRDDKVLKTFGSKKEKIVSVARKLVFKRNKQKVKRYVDVIIDGEQFLLIDGSLVQHKRQPHEMGNYELINYFRTLDIKIVQLDHYRITHKLMCERGLIKDQLQYVSQLENSMRYFSAWDTQLLDSIEAEGVF